jgi:hypothetical protein
MLHVQVSYLLGFVPLCRLLTEPTRPDRYDEFRFPPRAIEACLRRAHRVIAYAQWLAIEANAEHVRFLEFIKFIRSGQPNLFLGLLATHTRPPRRRCSFYPAPRARIQRFTKRRTQM